MSNPNSVLSDGLTIALPGASVVHVTSIGHADVLPAPVTSLDTTGAGHVWVLGLAPSTSYQQVVDPQSPDGGATGTPIAVSFSTPALPADLAPLSFVITNGTGSPEPGYYLLEGVGDDQIAVDQTGTIRWYRNFGQATQEGKMQYDGTFTSYVGTSTGFQFADGGSYVRVQGDGRQIAVYSATSPDGTEPGSPTVYTDPHELLLTADDAGAEHVHFPAYEPRGAPAGVDASAPWAYHELVRQRTDGTVELRWKSWSRFGPADRLLTDIPGDFDHINAIAIDPTDGNYVVSFRNINALVKIDYDSGAVVWQLGGTQGQFTFVGDPLGGFEGQHSVRVLPNGHILLYDNGVQHSPQESRAVEYALDTSRMTATLVWEFRHTPAIYTQFVGSVERLGNGDTLVAFGLAGVVDEVDPAGNVVWEGRLLNKGAAREAYRIRRLPSLYVYEEP